MKCSRFALLSFLPRLGGRRASFKIGVVATLTIAVAANIAVLGNLGVLFGRIVPGAAHSNLLVPYLKPTQLAIPQQGFGVPRPVYLRLVRELQGRAQLAAYETSSGTTGNGNATHKIEWARVTPSLASVLGVHPVAGRLFSNVDAELGAPRIALISARLAGIRFGSSTAALGKLLRLNQASYRVVGVLPSGLKFPPKNPAMAWLPLSLGQSRPKSTTTEKQTIITYLEPWHALIYPRQGLTPDRVEAALTQAKEAAISSLSPSLRPILTRSFGLKPQVASYAQWLYGPVMAQLKLLELAALLVVGLVLANLAGLAIADVLARRHEFATRVALGGNLWRLFAQRAWELILLGLTGWVIGVGLGWLGSRALAAAIGRAGAPVALSMPVLLLTLGAILAIATVLAGVGLWRLNAPRALLEDLMSGGRATVGQGLTRMLRALIVLQLAAGIVLLITAAHLLANVAQLSHNGLGLNPRNLSYASVVLPDLNSSGNGKAMKSALRQTHALAFRLLERLQKDPAIEAITTLSAVPLSGNIASAGASLKPLSSRSQPGNTQQMINIQVVSKGVTHALGLDPLAGDPRRIFFRTSNAVFIDARAAAHLFQNLAPNRILGRLLYVNGRPVKVAAVVASLRMEPYHSANGSIFMPLWKVRKNATLIPTGFALRSRLGLPQLRRLVERMAKRINPSAIVTIESAESIVNHAYTKRDRVGQVFGVLAIIAMLIAAVGLFALLAYRSLMRRSEFAIRGTLGATPLRLLGSVLTEAIVLWAIGCAIGVPAAYGLSLVLARHLPVLGLPAAWVALAVVTGLGLTALLAALAPARRAAGINLSGNLST